MAVKEGYFYSKSHEWVNVDGEIAEVGISDYAQNALGDIVFVNLNEPGIKVSAGAVFGDIESIKAVSDIYSPIDGEIAEVNSVPQDDPALLNSDPYGTWLIRIKDFTKPIELMNSTEYESYIETLD